VSHPSLERRADELAACEHLVDDQQVLVLPDGDPAVRCVECGAIYYPSDPENGWTRPVRVAHVVGVVNRR
jgi:phage pi2 protein 07